MLMLSISLYGSSVLVLKIELAYSTAAVKFNSANGKLKLRLNIILISKIFENTKKCYIANSSLVVVVVSSKIKKPKGLSRGFFPSFAIKILLNL